MYVGEFASDDMNGQGTLSRANGHRYTGSFIKGKVIVHELRVCMSACSRGYRWMVSEIRTTQVWVCGTRVEGEFILICGLQVSEVTLFFV